MKNKIVLASASPRRRELLSLFIKEFQITPANVDESFDTSKPIPEEVARIAALKADSIYKDNSIVIAADTVVVKDGVVYGKPNGNAIDMLRSLNGATHSVFTAVSVRSAATNFDFIDETLVTFNECSEELLHWYISTGEATDCAGSYAIQGLGTLLVRQIDGDYNNVVGLPISKLMHKLQEAGLWNIL
ncbi:MAG: Maf family protein [Deferribacteraceae bacterium]|nr:Maf family protein [Deferribacteraceae bacterium]